MESWTERTDEELIELLRKEEQMSDTSRELTDYLLEKYKYLVRKRANAMFLIGGDTDDLIQEGMIGLFKAVRDYRPDCGASFFHFADICIARQIYTAVEASQRKKHAPLNSYVSFWTQEPEENGLVLMDMLEDGEWGNPENMLIAKENYKSLQREIEKKLSKFENEVLAFYLMGMNYQTIAQKMNKSSKAIDNALQRIKNKIQIER